MVAVFERDGRYRKHVESPRRARRALSGISSFLRRSDRARSGHASPPRPFSPPGEQALLSCWKIGDFPHDERRFASLEPPCSLRSRGLQGQHRSCDETHSRLRPPSEQALTSPGSLRSPGHQTSPNSRRPARITLPDHTARLGARFIARPGEGQGCGAVRAWRTERARRAPGTPDLQAPERSEERRRSAGPEPAEGFLPVCCINSTS